MDQIVLSIVLKFLLFVPSATLLLIIDYGLLRICRQQMKDAAARLNISLQPDMPHPQRAGRTKHGIMCIWHAGLGTSISGVPLFFLFDAISSFDWLSSSSKRDKSSFRQYATSRLE